MNTNAKTITAADLDSLRHMLGIKQNTPPENWGYRNYFAAGGTDQVESMERLVAVGFVRCGGKSGELMYYHATEEGCRAVGMTGEQTLKALESD